ncbi:hypothetical protein FHS43_005513 [Streptosporangium becharense]|uniref:Uncharacterized protein n=1 Tax=Streptosporangium becharense TaxID=1816182 RepID=A0A7W9MEH2_9ACTN|nr:hypothetical protein [Streptosporangium becharense]MBB2914201.1 hypothetical protein [Streptosporangium becharense]MBB5817228.1 hypothetical protein [Streptosporangium becharense]
MTGSQRHVEPIPLLPVPQVIATSVTSEVTQRSSMTWQVHRMPRTTTMVCSLRKTLSRHSSSSWRTTRSPPR